jgi:hypothetical protein
LGFGDDADASWLRSVNRLTSTSGAMVGLL